MADIRSPIFDPTRLAAVYASGLLDTNAEEKFARLTGMASMLLDAPHAFVTVVGDTRSFWTSLAVADDLADRQHLIEESFGEYVLRTGEPLIVGDVTTDPRTADDPSIALMGVAAWAGYPLLGPHGEVLGTFCVVDTIVRAWTDRDTDVLKILSASAGAEIALSSAASAAARSGERAERSQQRLAFLAEVSEVLADVADTERAVGLLAQRIVALLCDWCLITIIDDVTGQRRDIGRAHRDPERLADLHRYADLHVVSESAPSAAAIDTGRPVIVSKLTREVLDRSVTDPASRAALAALNPAATAVFPLQGKGAPFGAIALVNGPDRGPLSSGELSLAHELARRAGLSLENARLHSHQRQIADVLQASLLSEPPQVEGLEIAVRYRPAADDTQVGGDWYDVFTQPDGSTMLVIGDVIGHDLHAVSVMAKLSTMMRSIGFDRGASPAEVLSRTDVAMTGLNVNTLCTAQILKLHKPAAGVSGIELAWSSAGHPAPMIIDAHGQVRELNDPPDLLLGVRAGAPRNDHCATLEAGQTLLLMTDGLFERRSSLYDASICELHATLSPLSGLPLERFCDELLAAALPPRPEDDVVIVAVRVSRG